MNITKEFRYLFEELVVYQRNLNKDNIVRRKDINVTTRKFRKLDKFKNCYIDLKEVYNKSDLDPKSRDEIKGYASNISKYINNIELILKDRLELAHSETVVQISSKSDLSDSESSDTEQITMSEKFELKTAATLLPIMNGNEIVTKQLIDAIELYDAMLDVTGKTLLTHYILKKCLSESAKIRLNKNYPTNTQLISDLKKYFITKKSVSHLSVKLNTAKQGNQSIEQFGQSIEELLTGLTITQSEGNDEILQSLGGINEKIAINTFASGIKNKEIRTIIKARNYSKLADAIQGAKDEDIFVTENAQVYHISNERSRRGRTHFHSSSGGNNFRGGSSRYASDRDVRQGQSDRQNHTRNYRGYNRGAFANRSRGSGNANNYSNRGSHSNIRQRPVNYTANQEPQVETHETFFRGPTEN